MNLARASKYISLASAAAAFAGSAIGQSVAASPKIGRIPDADLPAAATVVPANGGHSGKFIPVSSQGAAGTTAVAGNSNPRGGKPGLPSVAKTKKASLAPSGVWRWTTYNRSMQPEENKITLAVDKNGKVTGTLTDRLGEHPIKNVTVGDGTISFDVMYHARGYGDFPHTFTVNLDPDQPGVSVDRPDFSPSARAAGKKRHEEHKAKHDPAS